MKQNNEYNFQHPSFFDDPYPFYHRLRETEPVYWDKHKQTWLVLRYDDVYTALRDDRLRVTRMKRRIANLTPEQQACLQPLQQFYSNWLLYLDPPNHTRLRKAVNRAFLPASIEARRLFLRSTAIRLADNFRHHHIDVLHDYAIPYSICAVADMLGVQPRDYEQVKRWSDNIVDYVVGRSKGFEGGVVALQAVEDLLLHLKQTFADHTASADNSVLSLLVSAQQQRFISKDEAVATYANVLVDGHEPIANGLANSVLALLQHPSQFALLKKRRALLSSSIDECLRYNSPFQFCGRVAGEDVCIRGQNIREGERVRLMLGSANRDPDQFPNPDVLDITRSTNKHLAFALGTHYCLGATLARPALEIALDVLLEKYPSMRLDQQRFEWHHAFAIRGLKALPVLVSSL